MTDLGLALILIIGLAGLFLPLLALPWGAVRMWQLAMAD